MVRDVEGKSMRVVVGCFALLAAGSLTGCMAQIAPLSAQAGSSIVIPLNGSANATVGYGGTEIADPQRGQMRYTLKATPAGDVHLVTRASTRLLPHPGADVARGTLPVTQILSLVDIPSSVAAGTYQIDAALIPPAGAPAVSWDYEGALTVLPNVVGTSTGTPTPFTMYSCLIGCGFNANNGALATPLPEVVIVLSDWVWAADVTIEYPAATIDFVEAYEGTVMSHINNRALVWAEDDASGGVLQVHAAAVTDSFYRLLMVFDLAGATILNPALVDVTVNAAWDEDGDPIPGVTASIPHIQ
jgi:hypothetical protein